MEIYQIRAFVTVARLGNLTRAAEALSLTQPAVTGQIKALEQDLGVALFERTSGKLVLSKAGSRLFPTAEQLLNTSAQLKSQAQQFQGELQGEMVLGIPGEHAQFLRLGELVSAVVRSLPLIELKTIIHPSEELIEQIRSGKLMMAMVIATHPLPDLFWMALRTVRYRIVMPNDMADDLRHAGWKELAQLPWLDGSPGSHTHLMLRALFERHGLAPRIVMQNADMANADVLVRAGAGCALIREDIAIAGAGRREFTVWGHTQLDATLGFVASQNNIVDPIVVALISLIRAVWTGTSGMPPAAAKE
ncbi:LysR family transcriptional regulator [Advenella kashmirensis]